MRRRTWCFLFRHAGNVMGWVRVAHLNNLPQAGSQFVDAVAVADGMPVATGHCGTVEYGRTAPM